LISFLQNQKTLEDLFLGGHTNKKVSKVTQKLFGYVWGNSDKTPSHPQKFTCSYTYTSSLATNETAESTTNVIAVVSFTIDADRNNCYKLPLK